VLGNNFVAGAYKDPEGHPCTVSTSYLPDGRQEGAVSCNRSNAYFITASWSSGDIAGHPFELDLRAAGIDLIPGYRDYSWGRIGSSDITWWNCFATNGVISARQVGNQLTLTNYINDNIANCGVTLTLQP